MIIQNKQTNNYEFVFGWLHILEVPLSVICHCLINYTKQKQNKQTMSVFIGN